MDTKDLKKILAGVSIVGLLAGASLTTSGCATHRKSSCTSCTGKTQEKTSCTGKTPDPAKTSCSAGSCSGSSCKGK